MPPSGLLEGGILTAGIWGLSNSINNDDSGSGSGAFSDSFSTPASPPPDDDNENSNQCTFGKNTDKKIRKHIDQVRNRYGYRQDIPSPGQGGNEQVRQIIQNRVSQGGGQLGTYAGESALFYEDGNVVYVIRPNGQFWTILRNIR